MSTPNDGGPAFPASFQDDYDGMNLRDYFAAAALPALQRQAFDLVASGTRKAADVKPSVIAEDAYAVADAMLAEREKERQ